MSSSRDTDESVFDDGAYDADWLVAETYVAEQLNLDLDEGEHLGDDWVLTPNDVILAGCQRIIDYSPGSSVLEVLVAGLRASYHLVRVHALINQVARIAADRFMDGDRSPVDRSLLHTVSHAYQYGVKAADLDFVLEMCSDPALAPQDPEDGADFRGYWFASLAKIKDPRVGAFCRDVIRQDLGRWSDYRLADAMRVAAKSWEPADIEVFGRIAVQHPDSWIRQVAKRLLKRHS